VDETPVEAVQSDTIGCMESMEGRRPRVLVVDDERHIVDFVAMGLEGRGMEVKAALDGSAALMDLEEFRPDVMVLDLMLPGLSGLEVCRRARARSDVPILILSARDEVKDRVDGLNLGADDYVVKPFAFEELAARVVALLRRSGAPAGRVLRHAGLELDQATREVRRNGRPIDLTSREFALLRFFMEHPRQVLSKGQILEAVWGYDYVGDSNVVEAYVSYLRRKLNAPDEPDPIQTVRGSGYRLGG
jgi:two-component system, OmpR family, response regulator MprA